LLATFGFIFLKNSISSSLLLKPYFNTKVFNFSNVFMVALMAFLARTIG